MSGPNSPTKRRKRVLTNCRRKVAHATEAEAQAAIEEVRAAGKLFHPDPRTYRCPICKSWHWGRPPLPLPPLEGLVL